jgi:hypothetical protein
MSMKARASEGGRYKIRRRGTGEPVPYKKDAGEGGAT